MEVSSSLKSASLESQFESGRRQYLTLGGTIEAVSLQPESPKTNIPVMIAPGWGETKAVFKDCVTLLVAAGRPVIALDHPRKGGEVEPNDSHPVDELRKAMTILKVLEEEGIPQADIVTHSEGSINGAMAAMLQPDRVRNMVLFNPAGLIGKDSVPELLGRFALKNWQNILQTIRDQDSLKPTMAGQLEAVKYFLQNPSRGFQEIRAISESEIEDMLREIHRKGVGIVIVAGANDPGFPMSRMQQIVKSDKHPGGFVDGFLSVKGGHDELYIHPERYTKAAELMLTALERKQDQRSALGTQIP